MYGEVVDTSVAKLVGANARKIRLEAGITLDRMAQAARFAGLPWTTGRVGALESGRVGPTLPTLYALALALTYATGRTVTLADLLAGDGQVAINDELTVDSTELRDAVSGKPVSGETAAMRQLGDIMDKQKQKHLKRFVLEDFREADTRMCKNIGVTPEQGAAAMSKLWGRTFAEERDARAGADANAQRRGQISRQLKAELQKVVR
jgi:transcriptional regulator with XRE-family HTH domain